MRGLRGDRFGGSGRGVENENERYGETETGGGDGRQVNGIRDGRRVKNRRLVSTPTSPRT